jgi:hypothetical protein
LRFSAAGPWRFFAGLVTAVSVASAAGTLCGLLSTCSTGDEDVGGGATGVTIV